MSQILALISVKLGGDIVSGDGRGSVSIYGKYFEDENLTIDHTGPGFIGNTYLCNCSINEFASN